MKTVIAVVLLAAVIGSCYAALPIVPCDKVTHDLKIDAIRVFNSSWECTEEPCHILKGQNISVIIAFEDTGADFDDVINDVYGIYDGITVPFPGYPANMKDVCKLAADSTSHCPIKKGAKFTEKVTLPVPTIAIHGMHVIAKWEIVDPKDNMLGCVELKLEID